MKHHSPEPGDPADADLLCGRRDDALLEPVGLLLLVLAGLVVPEEVALNLDREQEHAMFRSLPWGALLRHGS